MADTLSRGILSWIATRLGRARRQLVLRHDRDQPGAENAAPVVDLQIAGGLFERMRFHVEDFSRGEEAGFLICSVSRHDDDWTLLAREWHPIPSEAIARREGGFMLGWAAAANTAMITRADEIGGALVLVHSHGSDPAPCLSGPDRKNAAELFPSVTRLLPDRPSGSVVLGDETAAGRFWLDGRPVAALGEIVVVAAPIRKWRRNGAPALEAAQLRPRLDRQTRAIGPASERKLREARVAVIGNSGGGSHVCQQLAHLGVGTVLPIDDQLVEDVNLSRMVGSTPTDVGKVAKTAVMERLIASIDPEIIVTAVTAAFPAAEVRAALKTADIIVSCVDSFLVREQINAFCRRYLIPLVDIGLGITTDGEHFAEATGQLVVATPDSACLRCTPLLSDSVLDRERRQRPRGYDRNPDAFGDPQVVSMNGVLASEACNSVLDLITGYADGARGAGWWAYDGRRGELTALALPGRWPQCPACAEAGRGDPRVVVLDDDPLG